MKRLTLTSASTAIACGVGVLIAACSSHNDSMTSTDPDTGADMRAATLVGQMTTDEKIQLVHGTGIPNAGLGGPFPSGVNGAGSRTISGSSTAAPISSWQAHRRVTPMR